MRKTRIKWAGFFGRNAKLHIFKKRFWKKKSSYICEIIWGEILSFFVITSLSKKVFRESTSSNVLFYILSMRRGGAERKVFFSYFLYLVLFRKISFWPPSVSAHIFPPFLFHFKNLVLLFPLRPPFLALYLQTAEITQNFRPSHLEKGGFHQEKVRVWEVFYLCRQRSTFLDFLFFIVKRRPKKFWNEKNLWFLHFFSTVLAHSTKILNFQVRSLLPPSG